MGKGATHARLWGAGLLAITIVVAAGLYMLLPAADAPTKAVAAAAPSAVPVSVAIVEPRSVKLWDEFSGRLEAVERVDIRSRVAGAIEYVRFTSAKAPSSPRATFSSASIRRLTPPT